MKVLFFVTDLYIWWDNMMSNNSEWKENYTSIFGVVFFVFKSLLGIEEQKKLEKFAILTRNPLVLVLVGVGAMLEYWYIERGLLQAS